MPQNVTDAGIVAVHVLTRLHFHAGLHGLASAFVPRKLIKMVKICSDYNGTATRN